MAATRKIHSPAISAMFSLRLSSTVSRASPTGVKMNKSSQARVPKNSVTLALFT